MEEYLSFFDGNLYKHSHITPERAKRYFEMQDKKFKELVMEDGIKNELMRIKEKYQLFIITSNKGATIIDYLERSNIPDLFKRVLGMEDDKSKIKKFEMILSNYNLKNDECIFITDTLGDIKEANKLNISTIAVDYGFHERERLEKGNPYKIISDFKEILPLVDNLE